jgi:hypothetical protein
VTPAGYRALGTAKVHCRATPGWGSIEGEPLADFRCDATSVASALAEQCRQRGGTMLVGQRCRGTVARGLSCSATIAAPANDATERLLGGPLVDARAEPPPFRAGQNIVVDLEPTVASFSRRRRAADEVGEHRDVPVSHRPLGSLRAHCPVGDCELGELRASLRIAAGALGVSDLAGVACREAWGRASCEATLAASERDPERDPNAR